MGEPIVWCLHGAVGEPNDWEDLRGRLVGSSEAIDLHRFLDEGDCSFDAFAEQLCVEAKQGSQRPVLLGYSLGGRLALHALAHDPDCWRGAIVVSAHPGIPGGDQEGRIARMAQDAEWAAMLLAGNWSAFLDRWNRQPVLQGELDLPWGDRAGLERRQVAVARSFVNWSLGRQEDHRGCFRQWELPVQWVVGERDEKFAALGREAVSLLPRAQLAVAENCGHRVPWEDPEWFAEQVNRFLESLPD